MATSNTGKTFSLKLLVDQRNQKVIFAEAGKDFVDFLFSLLSLPIGTVARLLSKNDMAGSLGKLYESFENLDEMCMLPDLNRDILLKPNLPTSVPDRLRLLTNLETPKPMIYHCPEANYTPMCHKYVSECSKYVSEDPNTRCPSCSTPMRSPAINVSPQTSVKNNGFVKEVTYIIMDDLDVKHSITIAGILKLKTFNVVCISDLVDKVVEVSMDEGVKLLRESLQSKFVLTNVFLR